MLPSAQISEKASGKQHYVVIPLESEKVFKIEQLSAETQTRDAIYISFKLLKEFESDKTSQNKNLCTSLENLIENYLKTKIKITIQTMEGILGKGGFANSFIKEGEALIYAGVLEYIYPIYLNSTAAVRVSEEFHSRDPLQYNAANIDTPARYFQHLPAGLTGMYNGETYASAANFAPKTVFARIKLSGKHYSIPIVLLVATRDIAAGELIGFDYGFDYWHDRGLPFLYLSATGKALTTYWLETINKRDTKFYFLPLNIAAFGKIVCHSYVELSQGTFLLPKESRERLDSICQSLTNESGSRVIALPTIVTLHPTHFSILDEKVFINLDAMHPFELGANKLVKHFEIIHEVLRSEGSADTLSALWIPLHTLVNSSTAMLINLRSFLLRKKIISEASFEISVNPSMLAEIVTGVPPKPVMKIELSRHKAYSLFGKGNKGPPMPAPVVEKIIELERCLYGVSRK